MKLEELERPDYAKVLEELVLHGILNIRDIPFEARVVNKTLYIYALRRNRYFNNNEECANFKSTLDILKDDIFQIDDEAYKKARNHLYELYLEVGTSSDVYKKFIYKTQKRKKKDNKTIHYFTAP